jgi:2-keto-4-pentenoate hydratase/2-oxohepta-3-ene-1,7-dioic acid hydratase in catechol pathway
MDICVVEHPSGFMDPPRSLSDGDVVEVEVAGIGCVRNSVVVREVAPT